jgi:hypothetical protein
MSLKKGGRKSYGIRALPRPLTALVGIWPLLHASDEAKEERP